MGQMKHYAAKIEAREACAQQIAVDQDILKHCEIHPDDYFRTEVDIEDAYRMAARLYKEGHYHDLFDSQRDFTDTIKKVVNDVWVDECPSCTNIMRQHDKHADPELH
jgi:hypothetical protein